MRKVATHLYVKLKPVYCTKLCFMYLNFIHFLVTNDWWGRGKHFSECAFLLCMIHICYLCLLFKYLIYLGCGIKMFHDSFYKGFKALKFAPLHKIC